MAWDRPWRCLHVALAASLAGLGALTGVTVASVPAAADVFDALDRVHSEQVTGDVVTVGNAVLVCPGGPEDDRDRCLAAGRRDNASNNNGFAMRYADVDSDDDTYNSSTAEVRLPAGARVTYARLSWAGNREGQQCAIGETRTFPDGAASTDPVRLSVGAAPARDVEPGERTTDTTSVGYYSADTVVTGAFAGLPVSDEARDVPVTVADVFTGEGRGCFGGWSLTLVHTADAAGCDAQRREVFVYDGHVRQGVGDAPQRVDVSGFRVAGGGAVRAGVTAYEGDNGQVGDRLRVNGTALADPATGRDDNFFASTAQGRVAPDYPNNFSVDAKRVEVPDGVIAPGDTEAELAVSTGASGADAFLLQGLTLSVPVPSLCLQKSVSPRTARVGDTVEWTLVVRNPSSIDATGVEVTDPAVGDCEQPAFDLAAGASRTLTCRSVVTEDLVNVASVAGTGGGVTLSAVDSAPVTVVDPSVRITKTAVDDAVVEGGSARWRLRVENTGDTRLGDVRVADPLVRDCDRDVGDLAPGEDETWTCEGVVTDDGTGSVTNTATVRAAAQGGPDVRDADAATVAVDPPPTEPAVAITKTAVDREVDAGDRARWDITVTNTGDGPLVDVAVDDPLAPTCDRSLADLPEGAATTYRCGRPVRADVVNVATVTATGDDGGTVTATDSAAVAAEGPFDLTVVPGAARTVPGEDVGVRVRVDNDGPVPVSGVLLRVDGAERCDRRLASLRPGDARTVRCTVRPDEDGDDLRLAAVATGRAAGDAVRATDVVRVPVLVPRIEVAVTRVPAADGTAGRLRIEVENTGETPLGDLRLGIDSVRLCGLPGARLAVGDSTTILCDAVRREVTARVGAQPVLGGEAVGPRVSATAASPSTSPDGIEEIGDDGTGGGTDPDYPGSPYGPGDPGATSPGGVLPDTGASRAMLPVALLGAGMLGAGGWLLRRSRRRPS